MNAFKIIAAGLALTASLPAAAATVINFDQLPNGSALPTSGTTISTQYASLGVTFGGTNTQTGNTGPLNAWGLIAATAPGGSRNYLANFGTITPSSPVPGPSDYLLAPRYDVSTLTFSNAVSGISFGLTAGGGQNNVTIKAYDALGATLQTLTNVRANNGTFDITTLTASGVSKIDIFGGFTSLPNGSVLLYGIDNLTFTPDTVTAPVPEPATWAMMIAGFGLVGGTMRRRRVQVAFA